MAHPAPAAALNIALPPANLNYGGLVLPLVPPPIPPLPADLVYAEKLCGEGLALYGQFQVVNADVFSLNPVCSVRRAS